MPAPPFCCNPKTVLRIFFKSQCGSRLSRAAPKSLRRFDAATGAARAGAGRPQAWSTPRGRRPQAESPAVTAMTVHSGDVPAWPGTSWDSRGERGWRSACERAGHRGQHTPRPLGNHAHSRRTRSQGSSMEAANLPHGPQLPDDSTAPWQLPKLCREPLVSVVACPASARRALASTRPVSARAGLTRDIPTSRTARPGPACGSQAADH